MLNHYLAHWPETNRALIRSTLAEFVEALAELGLPESGLMPDCYFVHLIESPIDAFSSGAALSVDAEVSRALDFRLAAEQAEADHKASFKRNAL